MTTPVYRGVDLEEVSVRRNMPSNVSRRRLSDMCLPFAHRLIFSALLTLLDLRGRDQLIRFIRLGHRKPYRRHYLSSFISSG